MALGIIPVLFFYLMVCMWFLYSCVLSDPSESSTARFFTQTLPQKFYAAINATLGKDAVKLFKGIVEKTLVMVYLVIVLGTWSIIFTYGYDFITQSSHVPNYHKYNGYIVFLICMSSWRKINTSKPGYITERTIPKFDNYPYDDLLYINKTCPTVGIRKLPRSKYDRFTGRHVARFDHFCGWVDNTVGEENYRYFLAFLAVHILMCAYGTIITYWLFKGEIEEMDLFNAVFYNGTTGQEVKADVWVIVHYLCMKRFQMFGVGILTGAMAVVLALFFTFHLYIAAKGMTTNEFYKWKQVRRWYKQEKRRYERAVNEGRVRSKEEEKQVAKMKELNDVDVGCVGPTDTSASKQDNSIGDGKRDDDEDEIMDPGPFPLNIYNLGIVENYKEIIFPRSLRPDAKARFVAALGSYKKNGSNMTARSSSTEVSFDKPKVK